MIVLGIYDGHNSSACVIKDGSVVAAVEEERIVRVKNYNGFPTHAVKLVLELSGVDMSQVDHVAMASKHLSAPRDREASIKRYRQPDSLKAFIQREVRRLNLVRKLYEARRRSKRLAAAQQAGIPKEEVTFVDHHLAHAAAAYYGWGRVDEDVLVLTSDGAGDYVCATVSVGRNGKLERLVAVPSTESLGNIYAMTTLILGMVPLEHEFKLMGMAPYAPPKGRHSVYSSLKPLMIFDQANGGITWRRSSACPEAFFNFSFFKRLYELKRFDWIAAGVQQFIEEMLVQWAHNCIKATSTRKVALGGGVFMNVKANKLIMELPEVEDLFVFPSCGDETNSIGAAMWTYNEKRSSDMPLPGPIQAIYYGPDAAETGIEMALAAYADRGWTCTQFEDPEREVARLLAEGEVVARCKGRMEFGARALGNRSILADPTRPEVIRIINSMVKNRDFWMPFAPAMLEERAEDYLVNPKHVFAPYMTLSFDTTDRVDELRAAVHPYDVTARPQVVRREWNPEFHHLLWEFERLTGRGVILNTSFNLHGFPIVMTAGDALEVFDKSGLQYLALDNRMICKS